jgi:MoaA/NifB/PqqE/SkfB family radical SAM enzyme
MQNPGLSVKNGAALSKNPCLPPENNFFNHSICTEGAMRKNRIIPITVGHDGRLSLPEDIIKDLGLTPGESLFMETSSEGLHLRPSPHRLARIYIEPTNACNLDCRTCMRNVWDEPLGRMDWRTFERILTGVCAQDPRPQVFFGGFGEPLAHPDIRRMVAAASQAGCEVELITNATLLNETTAAWMVDAGLYRLWVSIDGATPQSYADVRLGDALPGIIANLEHMQYLKEGLGLPTPKLGIAFVAMKRNIADLPAVIALGKRLGADKFSISNLLPHTVELRDEILYARGLSDGECQPSHWSPEVELPRMDIDETTLASLADVLNAGRAGGRAANRCPFIDKGSVSIRWDGEVSPCLPLLHSHTSFLDENQRTSHAYAVGNINDRSLPELWRDPGYSALRARLRSFDFSPCTFCNSCEMAESNREDCFGNSEPACGGCLWAQGFIQCP